MAKRSTRSEAPEVQVREGGARNEGEARARILGALTIQRGAGGKAAAGESRAILDDPFSDGTGSYGEAGARRILIPPLGAGSLRMLCDIVDESNILRQCVEAYQTNIDGFGHKLERILEPADFPKAVDRKAKAEAAALDEFFEYAHAEGSFVDLRKRVRRDMETCGQAYVEVLRDVKTGVPNRLNHVSSHTIRQTVYDPEDVMVEEKRRNGTEIKAVKVSRRFRTYVQIHHAAGKQEKVWFKEFGDPRFMDPKNGEFLKQSAGSNTQGASELLVFRGAYHPTSPYGLPRWIGNLPSVLGSRATEEINLLYFDNKAIPPMVVTVSGGVLTKGTMQKIEDLVNYRLKGRENFHEPLIIEAAPVSSAAGQPVTAPKIDIQPLTGSQLQDALFMDYDLGNRKKTRSSFRLTPLFTGETEDYNRATADASMLVVEEQVFRPERVAFDYVLNRWLLPELDSVYHKFTSLGPNVTMNDDLISALTAGEAAGGMTPNLARRLLADITESEIPPIAEPWGDVPFALTLAQMRADALAQAAALQGAARAAAEPPEPATGPDGKPIPPDKQPAKGAVDWERIAGRLPQKLIDTVLARVRAEVSRELRRRQPRR